MLRRTSAIVTAALLVSSLGSAFGKGLAKSAASDGGAVVYTAIEGRGVSGVKILGRGIIDTSEFARGQGGGSIHVVDSSDIKIDGVIVRGAEAARFLVD